MTLLGEAIGEGGSDKLRWNEGVSVIMERLPLPKRCTASFTTYDGGKMLSHESLAEKEPVQINRRSISSGCSPA